MADDVFALLGRAPEPDRDSRARVERRAAEVLRPTGALARLDAVAAWLATWQRTDRPAVERPGVVVFVADHGVVAEGVSAYPASTTAAMLDALRAGAATASVMARAVGAELTVIDVGVGRPTGNIVREPALTPDRWRTCFDAGRRAIADLDADIVVLGEMGIANTTVASAVAASLFGGRIDDWVGRGTGVDPTTLARKVDAVERAVARVGEVAPPTALRELGGAELAALAGAVVEARLRSLPVILDGFVVTAAAAPLELVRHGALDHCIAGHRSSEPGHALLLEKLGKEPLLDLDLRLGEGSGALAALPLVRLAARAVTDVATFDDWGVRR